MIRKLIAAMLPLVMSIPVAAAPYPDEPITIIVPFSPGGGTDSMTRLVSKMLAEHTGWNVVAENRSGAGGTIGITAAARAKPDGYHLVMGQIDNLAVAPWLYSGLNYDSVKSFTPIVNVAKTTVVIVTKADSPYKTLDDYIRAAKAKPESLTYGSPGTGTITHLSAELLQTSAGIKLVHVPYKGSSPAMSDLLGGQVPVVFTSVPSAFSQIKAGNVRALAVTSSERSAVLPDVPTVAEAGYKDVDVTVWYGLLGPAGVPDDIVKRVNTEVNKILKTPEMTQAMNAQGAEPIGGTPASFAQTLAADHQKWGPVVQASGAKVN